MHWRRFQLDGHPVSASDVVSAPLMKVELFSIVLAGGALMGDGAQRTILQHPAFIDRSFPQYPLRIELRT